MIRKKIAKHKLITQRRLQQKAELEKISAIKNNTLNLVLEAFHSVKNQSFSKDDIQAFKRCENYRNSLLQDNQKVGYDIFGLDTSATVSEICAKAASKQKWCQFLYQITKQLDNPSILEIGTNLGISGTYLLEASRDKNSFFSTMEGLSKLCKIASAQFKTITSSHNFEVIQGLYEDTFPKVIANKHNYNLLFIDGNHKKAPTLQYFNDLKSKMNTPAIFIFDDIYWSAEMKEAWSIIKNDIAVNFTIDLYEQGIVIIDTEATITNKHFSLHLSY